jgi:hypothetical protein
MDSVGIAASGAVDVARLTTDSAPGSISAGLAAALQAAVSRANPADSLSLVIVSPFGRSEVDAATWRIRATWPGAIRVVPLRAAARDTSSPRVAVRADSNDAIRAAAALEGLLVSSARGQTAGVRVIREAATGADSAWARDTAHVLVEWPRADAARSSSPRAASDTTAAVVSGDAVVVALFRRPWRLAGGTVIARWVDGEPAAVEQPLGAGCLRAVGIAFDEHSDIALRAPFRRLLRALTGPCRALPGGGAAMSTAELDSLRGHGGSVVEARALRRGDTRRSPWTPWLLAAGALLLILEMAVRRPPRRSAA